MMSRKKYDFFLYAEKTIEDIDLKWLKTKHSWPTQSSTSGLFCLQYCFKSAWNCDLLLVLASRWCVASKA